jgi:prolyl oligopeptidase
LKSLGDFLFATAEKDTRVDPMHARKMAASLQAVASGNDVLLLTEKEAGHGPGKPVKKIVELQAYILAFFAHRLGLKVADV